MRFHIEFETDNDAFQEGRRADEIARILKDLARRLETDKQSTMDTLDAVGVRIFDINGNRVGYAYFD